jgi:hypothetical protein
MCKQSSHMFFKSWRQKSVFLGYVFSENDPSFEQNNNFVYRQMIRRAVKFWKRLVYNFKQISHLP